MNKDEKQWRNERKTIFKFEEEQLSNDNKFFKTWQQFRNYRRLVQMAAKSSYLYICLWLPPIQ
jgi:hypothetical protein